MTDKIEVKWYGHSCMAVTAEGYTVLFDPYADGSVPGLKLLRVTADMVLCSHGHGDHNARECVKLEPAAAGKVCPFTVRKIESYHDPEGGRLRGTNTIHILEAEDFRIGTDRGHSDALSWSRLWIRSDWHSGCIYGAVR